MDLYKEKNDCTGCSTCRDLCPKGCIHMKYDKEGFLYPIIDEKDCTHCNICINRCPLKKIGHYKSKTNQRFYVAYHKSEDVLKNSTSGGAFTALSDTILKENGVIYGACFDENFKIVHSRAESSNERDKMRISKYVQSDLEGIYNDIKTDLKNNREVLFTGTPCQTAGVIARFTNSKFKSNLYICDLICHSIPSYFIWKSYLEMLESENDKKIIDVKFRSKKYPWLRSNSNKGFMYKLKGEDSFREDDRFYDLFIDKNYIVRPSCYNCKFTSLNRASDITIADYWGIEDYDEDWYNPLGVSLIITNSTKGCKLFSKAKKDLHYQKRNKSESLDNQNRLKTSSTVPNNRNLFWDSYHKKGLKESIKEMQSWE